jgi:hypothetical protein
VVRFDRNWCQSCDRTLRAASARIEEWNYTPGEYVFWEDEATLPKNGLFMGMELEAVHEDHEGHLTAALWYLENVQGTKWEDFIYMKSDSSVDDGRGVEFVTHPFDPRWGKKSFPVHLTDELMNLGFKETHNSAGTHLHVSKAAFSQPHLFKFIQIHNYLDDFCGAIGGRGTNAGYGYFWREYDKLVRKNDPTIITNAHKQIRKNWANDMKEAAKGYNPSYWGRGAVNMAPQDTIELRYPRSGLSQERILGLIEWVECLYNFSGEIKASDITKGVLSNGAGYLIGYIQENKNEFPHLWEITQREANLPKTLSDLRGGN